MWDRDCNPKKIVPCYLSHIKYRASEGSLTMKRKPDLPQKEIQRLLDYNPKTGVFRWKERPIEDFKECKNPYMTCVTRNAIYAGKEAGNKGDAYVKIYINGKNYPAHRLAWIHMNGDEPFGEIDHKNRNKKDNRIDNLRIVTVAQNQYNYMKMNINKSGVRGVHWKSKKGRWIAIIGNNNKNVYIGSFKNFKDAVKARYQAEIDYGFTGFNKESTAYRYLRMNS